MDKSVDKVILLMITTAVSAEASVLKCLFRSCLVFISHGNNLAYSAAFRTSVRWLLGLQRALTGLHIFTNLLTYEVASSAEASVLKCLFGSCLVFISHRNNLAYSAAFRTSIGLGFDNQIEDY